MRRSRAQYPLVELLTDAAGGGLRVAFGFGWQGFGAIVLTLFPDRAVGHRPAHATAARPADPAADVAGPDRQPRQPVHAGRSRRCWARSSATSACGRCGGCSSSSPARKAWATATSSCWPRWARGSACRASCRSILLSSLVGAIVGSVWLATKGRDRATPIPFGPYLAIAGWIVFFWGEQIIAAYRSYAGL